MKKNRRVGNTKTATNFFISDFKLRSNQQSKDKDKKMASTGNHFRRYHMFQQSSSDFRRGSREKKSVVQELSFLNSSRKEDFRLPKSLTKRSMNKTSTQNQKSRLERLNNQLYQNMVVGYQPLDKNKGQVSYAQSFNTMRKFKSSSINQVTKEKLEKTALEKFQQLSSKENQSDQNMQNEKKAQALFKYLRESRMKQQIRARGHNKYESQQPSMKDSYKNIVSEPGRSENIIEEHYDQDNEPNKNVNVEFHEEIANGKKEIFGRGEPNDTRKQQIVDILEKNRDENIMASFASGQKQSFNEEEDIKHEQHQMVKKESQKSIKKEEKQPLPPTPKIDMNKKGSGVSQKETQKIRKQSMNSQGSKKPPSEKQSSKKNISEVDSLSDLPEVLAVDKQKIKNEQKKQFNKKEQVNINQHSIEKVLTTQYLQKQTKKEEQLKSGKKIGPPPKLSNPPTPNPTPRSKATQILPDVDDELDEVDWNGKKIQTPKSVATTPKVQQQPQKNENQKQKLVQKVVPTPKSNAPSQKQPEPPIEQEQDSQNAFDALIFYIQRIQDMGQYRLNSKDIYSDKNIGKQLQQIYLITSYYMSHQFLYLTQILLGILDRQKITKDYFQIQAKELQMLKQEGQIDQDVESLKGNIDKAKKLLQKCYKQCKQLLKGEEKILLLDGKTNYHIKCSRMLIKQFKIIYSFYQKKPKSETIRKRCCYLIETFCTLKLLNNEELKQYEEVDEIDDFDEYIRSNKQFILGQ